MLEVFTVCTCTQLQNHFQKFVDKIIGYVGLVSRLFLHLVQCWIIILLQSICLSTHYTLRLAQAHRVVCNTKPIVHLEMYCDGVCIAHL